MAGLTGKSTDFGCRFLERATRRLCVGTSQKGSIGLSWLTKDSFSYFFSLTVTRFEKYF